ncbi:MAG: type II secretion system F family protein [Rhodoglobus sp.]
MSDTLGEVAAVTHRLAVLLAAGVAPVSAWHHVAVDVSSPVPAAAARAEPRGIPDAIAAAAAGSNALAEQSWRGLAAAWAVAADAGAPLAPSLTSYAASLRSLADAQRDVRVALAGPRATARIVMVLPLIGVLFGLALGFDTLGVLFTTVPGWVCIIAGAGLMLAARAWTRRLLRNAEPSDATPGLDHDLAAIAVSGGGALDRAVTTVRQVGATYGIQIGDLESSLALSRRAGVPAGDLLRGEAEELRRAARAHAQERAAALSVRLMLPLGLCVLPAFMALGVFPMLIAVVSSTLVSF